MLFKWQFLINDYTFVLCCCCVASIVSDSVRAHRCQPIRLLGSWDSPGKNTGVGCHLLLQCMRVKSESEVTQSCLTLLDPMDCSLPGSSVHGIFPGKSTGVGCHFLPPFCFIGKGNFKKFSQWFSFYWISSFINFIFLQSVSYCDCIAIREISLLQVSLQCESGLIK